MTIEAVDAPPAALRHLAAIGNRPRAAGSDAEAEARKYAAAELRSSGFQVVEEGFAYSRFPACYALPLAGAYAAVQLVLGAAVGLTGSAPFQSGASFGALVLLAIIMSGDGVLTFPYYRASATNLVATKGDGDPTVWLVSHLDSKSQPVATLLRVGGICMLVLSLCLFMLGLVLTLARISPRIDWWAVIVTAVAGGIPVMASVVRNKSNGALDNASGVAAVLAAAALLHSERVGVLITSAEELGLAGVRAWAKKRVPAIALNCDGVDDRGEFQLMYNGNMPHVISHAMSRATTSRITTRRMPFGILADSTALAEKNWKAVTLSHGNFSTLARVHSRADTLANLTGSNVNEAARILARSAEELAS